MNVYFLDDHEWKEERPDYNTEGCTTFIYNPNRSQSIDKQRSRLPIYQNRNHILYLLERHQIIILIGETGSGKSTQVPQVINEIIRHYHFILTFIKT